MHHIKLVFQYRATKNARYLSCINKKRHVQSCNTRKLTCEARIGMKSGNYGQVSNEKQMKIICYKS